MAKDLYCIVLEELSTRLSDSDIQTISEKLENGKTANVAYCKTFGEAKLLKESFEGRGAVVDVCLSRIKKEKKFEKQGTPFYDALCDGFEKYTKKRKELKKNLAFGVIGWPLIAIGVCLLVFGNLWGLLPLIPGVVVLDVSAFKLMLENNKKKKAEKNEDDEIFEETKGQKAFKIILEILKYIGVILFGAFVVLFRICKNLWQLLKIKRKYHLVMPFSETASFDILISLAVCVIFLLALLICIEIAKAIK